MIFGSIKVDFENPVSLENVCMNLFFVLQIIIGMVSYWIIYDRFGLNHCLIKGIVYETKFAC